MNGFELTKVLGAFCGAYAIYLALTIVTQGVFGAGGHHHGGHEKLAFAIPVEEEEVAEAAPEEAEPAIETVLASADLASGEKVFRQCKACHVAEKGGAHKVGPMLYGVVGREIGGTDFGQYSGALPGGQWDFAALNGFLAAPRDWAPGTSMGYAGLKKIEDRANLIAWLNEQSDAPLPLPAE